VGEKKKEDKKEKKTPFINLGIEIEIWSNEYLFLPSMFV
jgi:hypothetical protein